jgi:hypothetical protein
LAGAMPPLAIIMRSESGLSVAMFALAGESNADRVIAPGTWLALAELGLIVMTAMVICLSPASRPASPWPRRSATNEETAFEQARVVSR